MAMKRKSYVEGLTRGDGMETMPKDFSMVVKDIKLAILQARAKAARIANAEALKLYFFVGGYISKKTRNAKWGSGAIDALSNRLQVELPGLRGFSPSSIKNMRAFFEFWADGFSIRHLSSDEIRQIPSAESALVPIRQMPSAEIGIESVSAFLSVGFSQHREIIRTVQSKDEAWYYICASAKAPWSYEQLQQHLRADDYHHIGALPNNFEKTLSPMALASKAVRSFRDEYLLELVNLDNVDAVHDQDIDERVLSKELVANIEKTISALGGNDFCFMGREKRLVVEGEELYVDLLFYHRSLQAMVAIELKMGKFRASYLGQLSQYLSVLDAVEKKPNENPSIGLLLCEKVNKPIVQLTVQGYAQPIGIATYQALRNIPQPYKTLAPIIDGVRKVMVEYKRETEMGKNEQ
jgi:predicted nuclease of restriction endonuclease-like (RecB) superfamily